MVSAESWCQPRVISAMVLNRLACRQDAGRSVLTSQHLSLLAVRQDSSGRSVPLGLQHLLYILRPT